MPSPWIFTAITVLATAGAHLMFKLYATVGGWWRLGFTIGLFLCAPVSTYIALQQLSFAQVYLCTAAVPVLGLGAAHVFLGESIRRSHVVATVLIAAGIAVYQSAALNP